MHELNDSELSKKIKSGNERAFREIYERYHVQMFDIAKKYVKSSDLSSDSVQDIFVKLWKVRNRIDETKPIKRFLFSMLRNHLLNMISDRKSEIVSHSNIETNKLPHQHLIEDEFVYKEYHEIIIE